MFIQPSIGLTTFSNGCILICIWLDTTLQMLQPANIVNLKFQKGCHSLTFREIGLVNTLGCFVYNVDHFTYFHGVHDYENMIYS